MTIGDRITMLCLHRGLTGEELAERVGVEWPQMDDILLGRGAAPMPKLVLAIAKELDTTLDWLWNGTPDTHYVIERRSDRLVVYGTPIPIREFVAIGKLGESMGYTHLGSESGARLVLVRKEDVDE